MNLMAAATEVQELNHENTTTGIFTVVRDGLTAGKYCGKTGQKAAGLPVKPRYHCMLVGRIPDDPKEWCQI